MSRSNNVDDDPAPQPLARHRRLLPQRLRVFDLYKKALERYRLELTAWRERQATNGKKGGSC